MATRILVTGATGCLGYELTRQLVEQGHDVIAMGRDTEIGKSLTALGARFLARDLCAPYPLGPILQGVEIVHHCAALSSAWGPRAAFEAINVEATRRLVEASRDAGVRRFVFTSSPSIYADGSDRLGLTEDAPLPARFATDYARTKAEAEALVLAADCPNAMRSLALRPRAIYGRGDRSLLPRLLAAMRRGRVPLIGGGRALIDLTHVSDAARAQICAQNAPNSACGRAYNITSGEAHSFASLLDTACARFGLAPRRIRLSYGLAMAVASGLEASYHALGKTEEPPLTRQAVASLGRSLTLEISAARHALAYAPQVALTDGIADYAH